MNIRSIIKNVLLWCGSIIYYDHKSKILFYHDVFKDQSYKSLDSDILMGTNIELFKKHLALIKEEGYDIVASISKPDGEVCIMFDDGFRGIWDNRQFFYENNLCPKVFLAVELIGKEGFLNLEEILDLQNHGFVFECHSWTHANLTEKNDNELTRELSESKKELSNLLHKDVSELCLPIGFFSDHLITRCRDYGYKEVYSSIPGNYCEKIHGWLRPRILCQFSTTFEMKMILRGGAEILRKRYERMHFCE